VHRLIASDRVDGTRVCGADGHQLGVVERLMINKVSGQVAYAVMKAILPGMPEKRFPIAWEALHYDREHGVYVVELTAEDIRHGPAADSGFDWGERGSIAHVRHYRPRRFWDSAR
jgi:hypothetical protein